MNKAITIVHGWVFLVWVIVSTFVYAMGVFLTVPISRTVAWALAGIWCRHLLAVAGVRVRISGIEKIDNSQSYFLVANHSSALDIPVLMGMLPLRLLFMAKKELFRIPVFGWGLRALGHLPVDRSSARKARLSMSAAAEKLKAEKGIGIVIFPEGTRSSNGEIADFKKGSFALALEAGVSILPVHLKNAHKILPKGAIFPVRGNIEVLIGEPISIASEESRSKAELAEEARNAVIALQ